MDEARKQAILNQAAILQKMGLDDETIFQVVTGQAPLPPQFAKQLNAANQQVQQNIPHSSWGSAALNTLGDAAQSGFFGKLAGDAMAIPSGIASALSDPKAALSGYLANLKQQGGDVATYAGQGNYGRAAVHAATLPFEALGMPLGRAHNELVNGDTANGLADATFSALLPRVPDIAASPTTAAIAGRIPGSGLVMKGVNAVREGMPSLPEFNFGASLSPKDIPLPTEGGAGGPTLGGPTGTGWSRGAGVQSPVSGIPQMMAPTNWDLFTEALKAKAAQLPPKAKAKK